MQTCQTNHNHRSAVQIPQAPQSTRNRDIVNIGLPQTVAYDGGIPNTVDMEETEEYQEVKYDKEKGFGIHFDFISGLERSHRDIRLIYGIYNYTKVVVANKEVGTMQSEPDPADMSMNRVFFDKKHIIKSIKPHAGHNLILEFQARRTDTAPGETKYASIGWTMLNLFDSVYELNVGQFRAPLYKTPTQPDLDIRDIGKLSKIDKLVFCFRIALPKSPLSKLKVEPNTHPNQYQMPDVHAIPYEKGVKSKKPKKNPKKDRMALKQQLEEEKIDAEAYECSGINVFVHFIKDYEPAGLIRIRCTLYEGPKLVRDNNGHVCQWASRVIHPGEALTANQENMDKLLKMGVYVYNDSKYGKKDIVIPINDDHSWLRDFYSMLMDNHLKDDMYLMVEIMVKDHPYKSGTFKTLPKADPDTIIMDYQPIAATMVKCSNFDGTIRYGSYELPFFEAPLNRDDPSQNKELPYITKVTVGQPLNLPEKDFFNEKKPESLFRKPDGFQDQSHFPKRNPNADNPDPFIPNEKSQVAHDLFKKDDIAIIYIDGARFLPENSSFSRVVMT